MQVEKSGEKREYNEDTNMRAQIVCMIKKAKQKYPQEDYEKVVREVLDAACDVRQFPFHAINAYNGDEQEVELYPEALRKAEEGIRVVNEYAEKFEMTPIIPEPDGTLVGLFNVCRAYKYDANAYLLHHGPGIDIEPVDRGAGN